MYKKIVVQNGILRYYQVALQIKEAIDLGYHKKGDILPSIERLVDLFGVSRITIRKALDELEKKGIVEKVWGKGVFVNTEFSQPGKNGNIGLIVYNEGGIKYHPAVVDIVRGINETISSVEYTLNIIPILAGEAEEDGRMIAANDTAGLICYSGEIPDDYILNLKKTVPSIVVAGDRRLPGFPSVVLDVKDQMFKLTEHLIGLGHRKIVFMEGPMRGVAENRHSHLYNGFEKAIKKHGLSEEESFSIIGECTSESGYSLTSELIFGKNIPTAIIANDDIMALGVLKALQKAGISCPKEISLAAINDFPFSDYIHPPLTTVRVPYDELGRQLAQSLLDLIDGKKPADKKITGAELRLRNSTASAPVVTGITGSA